MGKTFRGGVPKHSMAWIRLITQMENPLPRGKLCSKFPTPRAVQSGKSPHLIRGGPSWFHLIAPLLHKRNFPGKPGRARSKFHLKKLKPWYHSNIVFILYCPKFTVSTFSGGLHLCTSSDLNSNYYINAIFQENQEDLETKFLFKNEGVSLF